MCQLNKTLEDICNGYPFDNFSIGRKLTLLFFSHLFNRDFSTFDKDELKKLVTEHTILDSNAAYEAVRSVFKVTYNVSLPKSLENFLEDERVHRFRTEGDYIRYIAEKPSPQELGKLNSYTRANIEDVKANSSELLDVADKRNIDVISFVPREFGADGKITSFRRKPLIPVLKKFLSRGSEIFVTEEEILEEISANYFSNPNVISKFKLTYRFNPLEDIQAAYTILVQEHLKNIVSSNKDMHFTLNKEGYNWENLEPIRKNLKALALVDVGGLSFSGNVKEVKHLITSIRKFHSNYIIEDRIKDNLTDMIKDSSYVMPLKGRREGTYLECRFSPFQNLLYGMFGFKFEDGREILAHPLYKKNEDQKIFRNIGSSGLYRTLAEDFGGLFGYRLNDIFRKR